MKANIESRIAELRYQSFTDLATLPEYSDSQRAYGKWTYTLATWRDQKSPDLVQIVVQAYYHWMLGIGTMMADGFRIQRDGTVIDLPQDVRYEFT